MKAITSSPGALRLFVLSLVGRLPLSMFTVALLLHAQYLSGSLPVAGAVTGAYAISLGIGGPFVGRRIDRRGQTAVLLACALITGGLLTLLALLPKGAPAGLIIALAAGAGLASPPIDACMRTLFGALLPDEASVRAAYAIDAAAEELTWVCGPLLVLGLATVASTGAAVGAGAGVVTIATTAFALLPGSRGWRPEPTVRRSAQGSFATPAMRLLVIIFVVVGVLFGASEVGVTAAAEALGSRALAGPLLALWGAGSLVGGLINTRIKRPPPAAGTLIWLLAALALGHLAVSLETSAFYLLGAGLFVSGASIAPTYATMYAIVDLAAPAGTLTEAFTWLGTAIAVGSAMGAAIAGAVAHAAGPAAVFWFAGAAGGGAVLIALVWRHSLVPPSSLDGEVELLLEPCPSLLALAPEGEVEDGSPTDQRLTPV